jgi:hypothetical protein
MSLAKQAINIGLLFLADTDTANNRVEYQITVQNKDIQIVPEYFSGGPYDESIGGKRISNLRGYRVRINLSFDGSLEKTQKDANGTGSYSDSTFREMFNEIMSCFSAGQIIETLPASQNFTNMHVRVHTDTGYGNAIPIYEGSGSFMPFVPEDLSYQQTYTNQIGRFRPSITLVSETLMPNIPEELQGVL